MPNSAWHSSRDVVHHTHPDCQLGQSVRAMGAWPGDGGLPHCAECRRLMACEAENQPDDDSDAD